MENLKFVDSSLPGFKHFEGFLKKLKSENSYSKIFGKFNKRFFVFDLQEFSFSYKTSKSARKLKKFSLADLDLVDSHPRVVVKCDWKFAFLVKFTKKTFMLFSETLQNHQEWCKILKTCVKPLVSNLFFASFPTDDMKKPVNLSDLSSFEGFSLGNGLTQTPKFREFEGFFESPSEVMRKKVVLTEVLNSRPKTLNDEKEPLGSRSSSFQRTGRTEVFRLNPVLVVEDDGCEETSGLIAPVCVKSNYFKETLQAKTTLRTRTRVGIKKDIRRNTNENISR